MSGKKQKTQQAPTCPRPETEGGSALLYCESSQYKGVVLAQTDGTDTDPAWEVKARRWEQIHKEEWERECSVRAARRTDRLLSLNRFLGREAKDDTESNRFFPFL